MFSAGIITCSDKGSKGERIDVSGEIIRKILIKNGFTITKQTLVPDEESEIAGQLIEMTDNLKINLIITTGGTGFSVRDITPEATKAVIEREAQGISEAMRSYSLTITKRAMLSRGISGIRGNSLIINLPGSPKAVEESLTYIIGTLIHGIEILVGSATECGRV